MTKKIFFSSFAFALSIFMIFSMSTVAFATTPDTSYSIETRTDDYGIAPASYVGPVNITVSNGTSYLAYLDSRYAAYEYSFSNSSSVRIETYVDGVLVKNNTVSGSGKVDWIDMKSNGNHSVVLKFYTNSTVNVQLKLYSWQ